MSLVSKSNILCQISQFPTSSSVFYFMWTIFKVIIEFVAILFVFYVLVFWPPGIWDLIPTRD